MARMAQLAADLAEIDTEIMRLHDQASARDADEYGAALDRIQIDELLERRHRLYPKEAETANAPL